MSGQRDIRTLRLPAEVDRAIRQVSEQTGEAQAVVIRAMLREALERHGALDPSPSIARLMARTDRVA